MELLKTLLIVTAVVAVIAAIFRELLCWFWKINLQVSLLQDISRKLDALEGMTATPIKLGSSRELSQKSINDNQAVCASCGSLTSTEGEFCEQCGSKWKKSSS